MVPPVEPEAALLLSSRKAAIPRATKINVSFFMLGSGRRGSLRPSFPPALRLYLQRVEDVLSISSLALGVRLIEHLKAAHHEINARRTCVEVRSGPVS